jgi:hypothetical protein
MIDGCGFQEGMQKEIFAAFVAELESHCCSILVGVDTDYQPVSGHTCLCKGDDLNNNLLSSVDKSPSGSLAHHAWNNLESQSSPCI